MAISVYIEPPDYTVKILISRRCVEYYIRWYYNGWHYWNFYAGNLSYQTEGENYRTQGRRIITASSGQVTLDQAKAIKTILNSVEAYLWTDNGWTNIRVEPGQAMINNNYIDGAEVEISAIIGSRLISQTGLSPSEEIPVIEPSAEFCEVIIGNQTWMCKNWDSDYPGSRVYNNDEANREIYGGLYHWMQAIATGFAPSGWRLPTRDDFQELITFLGGSSVAGGKLKEIEIGGSELIQNWGNAGGSFAFETFTSVGADITSAINTGGTYGSCNTQTYIALTNGVTYKIVINLTVNSGTAPKIGDFGEFFGAGERLSNGENVFYITPTGNLAGYTLALFDETEAMNFSAVCSMKEVSSDHWNSPNTGATNDYNFSARGAGLFASGIYSGLKGATLLLSSTPYNLNNSYVLILANNSALANLTFWNNRTPISVRLIKDTVYDPESETFGDYKLEMVNKNLELIYIPTGEVLKTWRGYEPLVYDLDGNSYETVKIGSQEWIKTNFRCTKYADGSIISNIQEFLGNDDWFLPSKDELNAMYTNLHLYGIGDFNDTPTTNYAYWTSSQTNATWAKAQLFSSGGLDSYQKSSTRIVRACRSFTAAEGTYSLRDIGPAGGWIFYINGTTYYEAAPSDQGGGIVWSNISDVSVTTGTAIGTGAANTAAIIAQEGHTASAAKLCDDYISGVIDESEGVYYILDDGELIPEYGLLYNFHAVAKNIAYLLRTSIQEGGWRVPTNADFQSLSDFLGGNTVSGGKLKEAGLAHWNTPNEGATNESEFTALGAGRRIPEGTYAPVKVEAYFWTSEEDVNDLLAHRWGLVYSDASILPGANLKEYGFSIRLMRDI